MFSTAGNVDVGLLDQKMERESHQGDSEGRYLTCFGMLDYVYIPLTMVQYSGTSYIFVCY